MTGTRTPCSRTDYARGVILDAFFQFAVPFVMVVVVVASLVLTRHRQRPFYADEDGPARRDAINKKYGVNKGMVLIALVFLAVYVVIVISLVERWGPQFFTWVIAALMLLPVGAVCAGAVALYGLTVHALANRRR